MRADVVEELGSEINVIFRIDAAAGGDRGGARGGRGRRAATHAWCRWWPTPDETVCTARVNARSRLRAGDDVGLAIATDRFHFFDLESGEAIATPAQPAATG